MPPPPPALPVPGLIDDDPVDPGPQRGLAPKAVDGAEDPEEDFLGKVEGLVMVAEEVQRQLIDHALVLSDELRAGILIADGTALNQAGLATVDVGPCNGSKRLHGKTLCHLTPAANAFRWHPFPLRTRPPGNVPGGGIALGVLSALFVALRAPPPSAAR